MNLRLLYRLFLSLLFAIWASAAFGQLSSGVNAPHCAFTGTLEVGDTLFFRSLDTALTNHNLNFQWYTCDDKSGTGRTAISTATDSAYILREADTARFIQLGVTPQGGYYSGTEIRTATYGIVYTPLEFFLSSPGMTAPYAFRLSPGDIPANAPFQLNTASLGLLMPQISGAYPNGNDVYLYGYIEPFSTNSSQRAYGYYNSGFGGVYKFELSFYSKNSSDSQHVKLLDLSGTINVQGSAAYPPGSGLSPDHFKFTCSSLSFSNLIASNSVIGAINTFLMGFKLNLASTGIVVALNTSESAKNHLLQVETDTADGTLDRILIKDIKDLKFLDFVVVTTALLQNDIDATETQTWNNGKGWNPLYRRFNALGMSPDFKPDQVEVYLEGGNHTIKGLHINRPNEDEVGIFQELAGPSYVRNLALEDLDIKGKDKVGAFAGTAESTSSNDTLAVTGRIEGQNAVGALFGEVEIAKSLSLNYAYSTAQTQSTDGSGALIGNVNGSANLNQVYASGAVSGTRALAGGTGGVVATESYYNSDSVASSSHALPLTTAQMKQFSNYNNWDFDDVWGITPLANNGFPILRAFYPGLTVDVLANQNPFCPSDSTGSIQAYINGGAAPYQFSWGDGDTNLQRTGLPAGTYSYQVIDALGDTLNSSYTLTANDSIAPQLNVPVLISGYLDPSGIKVLQSSPFENYVSDNCSVDSVWISTDSIDCSSSNSGAVPAFATFDGINDFAEVPNDPAFNFTKGVISIWVQADAYSYNAGFVAIRGNSSRFSFHLNQALGQIGLWNNSSYTTLNFPGGIEAGKWYHLVFVLDGNGANPQLWADGNFIGSFSANINLSATTEHFVIGSSSGFGEFFKGKLAQVAIFDSLLATTDMTKLWDEEPVNQIPHLLAYYPLLGSNSQLKDFGPNAFDGQFQNWDPANRQINSVPVQVYARDTKGLIDSATTWIFAQDTTAPEIHNTPANISVSPDSTGCYSLVNYSMPTATDNCSLSSLSMVEGLPSGSNFPSGVTEIVFVALDASGNSDTSTFSITVSDSIKPSISVPSDTTIVFTSQQCGQKVTYSLPQVADNCDISQSRDLNQTSLVSNYSVDYTGNHSSYARVYDLGVEGLNYNYHISSIKYGVRNFVYNQIATVNIYLYSEVTTGNVSSQLISYSSPLSRYSTPIYTYNDSLKVSTGSIRVVPVDLDLPAGSKIVVEVITPNADFFMGGNTDKNNETQVGYMSRLYSRYQVPGYDFCPLISIVGEEYLGLTTTLKSGLPSGSNFSSGVNKVTYQIEDGNGNLDSASFLINVVDSAAPTVYTTNLNFKITDQDSSICGYAYDYGEPSNLFYDACGLDTVIRISGLPTDTIFPLGLSVSKYIAYDNWGNVSDTAFFRVTVVDEQSPTPILKDSVHLYLDSNGTVDFDASIADLGSYDNCSAIDSIIADLDQFDCSAVDGFSNASPSLGYLSFDGVDDHIEVVPNMRDGLDTFTIEFWYRDVLPDSLYATSPDYFYGGGGFSIGNDTINQVAVGLGNQYAVNLYGPSGYRFNNYGAGSRRWRRFRMVRQGPVWRTFSNDVLSGIFFYNAPDTNYTLRIGTVHDTGPNAYISQFFKGDIDNIRIWDTISFPGQESIHEDHLVVHYDFEEGTGSQLINRVNGQVEGQLTNMDSIQSWVSSANTVKITLFDEAGNSSDDYSLLFIHDTIAPVLQVQNPIVYLDSSGYTYLDATNLIDTLYDACGIDTVYWDRDTLSCADLGSLTVTLETRDNHDNQRTRSTTVEVRDTIFPLALARNLDLYLDASGSASIEVSDIDSGSYDPNCSLDTLYLSKHQFSCTDTGAQMVYLIAIDLAGNLDSALANIEVLDTNKPTVITQDISVYLNTNGQASIQVSDIDNGTSKACGNLNLDLTKASFDCNDLGANSIWLIADDGAGNRDSALATVTVLDTLKPTLQANNQVVYLDANGQAAISTNQVNNGSTDNCSIQSLSLSQSAFGCTDLGMNQVYLIAMDTAANMDSVAFTVEVLDSIRPVAQARNMLIYLDATGQASLSASQVNIGSSGNCSLVPTISQTVFNCADEGLNLEMLRVTDPAGNQDSATFLVEVRDTISPVVIPRNITVQLGATGQVSVAASQVDSASYDNCSNQLFYSISKSSFNCSNLGLNTVSLTATDGQGNSTTAQAQILVEDNILPVVRSRNLSLYLDANGLASITTGMLDNGSTDNCSIDSLALSQSDFSCADLGQNTISFMAFDQSGNSNSTNAIITVIDTVAPVLSTQSINVYLDANGQASITANDLDNGTTDNCAIQNLQISQTNFDCSDLGQVAIQFTAIDASGNSHSQTLNVMVLDTISPTVVGGSLSLNLDANGQASLAAGDINSSSSDNCGISQWSLSQTSFDCTNLGSNTISLTGTDASGNSHSANWTISIADTSAPTVLTQNQTLYLDANGNASLSSSQVDAGSYDNCGIQNLSLSQSTFDCSDIGTLSLSLSADDASANMASANFVTTVLDTMAPVLSTQSINVYLDANGQATITANDLDNGSADNCAIQDLQISQSSFDCSDLGNQTLTFTALDVNGNQRSTQVGITVLDTVSPIVPGGSFNLNLDANGAASLSAADINGNASDNCGVTSWTLSQTSFSCADVGSNTVSLTATDASGNSQTTNYTILVQDALAPVLNLQNITVYLTANGMRAVAATEVDNVSSDNCAIASRVLDIDTFDCADLGQNLVNFTATDVNGNAASQNVIITVKDTISPSIVNLPTNITAYTDPNQCGTIVQWPAILGSDNCGSATVSTSQTNGGLFAKGLTNVNVLVQDANGNSQSGSFTINVLDTIAPLISNVPQVYTVLPNAGSCDAGVNWIPPVASDNCGTANLTSNYAPGATLPVGTTTIVYTATDADGNSRSVSFDVTVTDAIAPQFSNVPADIVQANDAGQCGANVSWTAPNATDNCTVSTFSSSHNSGDFFATGTTTVTYTATDAAGNQTSISFDITVEDQEKPVVSSVPVNDTVGQCGAAYVYSLPTATDNCGTVNVQQIAGLPSGNVFPIGVTQNSFRISDAAGNDTVVGFTVVVIPQGQANLPDLLEICANAPAVDITEGQATINWSGPGIINSGTTFDPARAGTGRKTLTYTFVDDYGCSVSGSIIVTVLPVPSTPQIVQVASNTLSTTQTYSTYQWYRDGVAIPGAVNQNYSYTQSGHYQVIVGNISGCEVFGAGYAIGPIHGGIGVEEFNWSDMQVYPNPNDGLFTIDFAGLTKENMKVQVLSTDGKLVYESQQKLNAESQIRIDLRGLPAAVYYLRVSNGATRETRKLIIY